MPPRYPANGSIGSGQTELPSTQALVPGRNQPHRQAKTRQRETSMRDRFLSSAATLALAAAGIGAIVAVIGTQTSAQAPTLKTPWGEPDLQGIWAVEYDTPFQRSARFANQEFFTDEQRAEFDRVRSQGRGRDVRGE